MKAILTFSFSILFFSYGFSQKLIDIFFVADGKIIEDAKKATGCILIKINPDSSYERKDYKMFGPLKMSRTFLNAEMKVLQGSYESYHDNGQLSVSGSYHNNSKEGRWNYYDDKGKHLYYHLYEKDSIKYTKETDHTEKKESELAPGEVEAQFKGGIPALKKFLIKNIEPDISLKTKNGGQVRVAFMINTSGKIKSIHLKKSVEAILDEEAIRVISIMPDWIPAQQDGKTVNAYRIQPISFSILE